MICIARQKRMGLRPLFLKISLTGVARRGRSPLIKKFFPFPSQGKGLGDRVIHIQRQGVGYAFLTTVPEQTLLPLS
jgi:hypothetical protein